MLLKAIILAGGKGERLRPLTDKIPKPMIKVDGKPILEHIILQLKSYGIKKIIICLCYLPQKIISYFGDGSKWAVNIKYLLEEIDSPLGTAGAILQAKKLINGTFIVCYGDILRDLDIKKMIAYHKKNKSLATINCYKRYSAGAKSMVVPDKKGKIIRFVERPTQEDLRQDYIWTNGSFYIFEPQIFNYIEKAKPSDFGSNIFPALIKTQKNIYSFESRGYFLDISDKDKLNLARRTFSS